jgi:hypothetical protein
MITRNESLKVLNDLNDIIETAAADISMSQKMVKKNHDQFWRRTFVRSLFAGIDGINHHMKHLSILMAKFHEIDLTHAEIAMLREETYTLNEKGIAISLKSKLRTKDNLCFTVKIFARACNSAYEINRNCEEWASFSEAIRVRDRLTHPKSSADLNISDAELKTAQKTFKWYIANMIKIVDIAKTALLALLEKDTKKTELIKTNSKVK